MLRFEYIASASFIRIVYFIITCGPNIVSIVLTVHT